MTLSDLLKVFKNTKRLRKQRPIQHTFQYKFKRMIMPNLLPSQETIWLNTKPTNDSSKSSYNLAKKNERSNSLKKRWNSWARSLVKIKTLKVNLNERENDTFQTTYFMIFNEVPIWSTWFVLPRIWSKNLLENGTKK